MERRACLHLHGPTVQPQEFPPFCWSLRHICQTDPLNGAFSGPQKEGIIWGDCCSLNVEVSRHLSQAKLFDLLCWEPVTGSIETMTVLTKLFHEAPWFHRNSRPTGRMEHGSDCASQQVYHHHPITLFFISLTLCFTWSVSVCLPVFLPFVNDS